MTDSNQDKGLNPESQIKLFLEQAGLTGDSREKAILHYEVGQILQRQSSEIEPALEHYRKAIGFDGENPQILRTFYEGLIRNQNWPEALLCLEQLLKRCKKDCPETPSPEYLRMLMDQAHLYNHRIKDTPKAVQTYLQVLEIDPQYRPALSALETIYMANQNWQELISLLETLQKGTRDESIRVGLLYRISSIYLRRLANPTKAVEALNQILELKPEHLPALRQLQVIYQEQKLWSSLGDVYEKMAGFLKGRGEANQLLKQAAQIWLNLENNPERGVLCLEQVIKEDSGDWETLEKLRQHYEREKTWGEYQRILELQLSLTKDQNFARTLKFSLGEVLERMGNDAKAIEYYQEVLKEDPRDLATLRNLGAYYGKNEDWVRLAALYENELQETKDPGQVLSIVLRLAVLYERNLQQFDKAISCLVKAVELWPQNPLLLWQLQKLYQLSQDWEKLVACLSKELQETTDPDRKRNIFEQLGDLAREKFKDDDRAIAFYQEILKINPKDLNASRKTQDLYQKNERWTELAAFLGQQIAQTQHSAQMVGLYLQAAEIFDQRLNQMDSAVFCYQKAMELAPNHLPTIHAFGSLLARKGDWKRLVGLYEQEINLVQDASQKGLLFYRMGKIYETQLKDLDKAIQSFLQTQQLNPHYVPAVEALIAVYEVQENWPQWAKVMNAYCQLLGDPQLRSMTFWQIANVKHQKLKDVKGAREDYLQALKINPKNSAAGRSLFELYHEEGQWLEMAELLARLIEACEDPQWAIVLSMRLAEIREIQLEDLEGAKSIWEKVLAQDAQNILALNTLERLYRQEQDWPGVVKILSHRTNLLLKDKKETYALPILEELAYISLEHFQDVKRGCAYYQKILEIDPKRRDIYHALRVIYLQYSRWQEMAELLRTEIKLLDQDAQKAHESVELYQELALIYETQLKRVPEAITCWNQVRKIRPKDLLLFKSLERLFTATKDYAALAELYESFAEHLHVKAEKVRILIAAGELLVFQLNKSEKAKVCFEKAVELDPNRTRAWEALQSLYEAVQDWPALIRTNLKLLELFKKQERPVSDQVDILRKIAHIYETKSNDPKQALENLKSALELSPSNMEVSHELVRLHKTMKSWDEVLGDYSHIIAHINDPPQAVSIYQQRGQVLADEMGKEKYAVLHFEKALAIDPLYVPALKKLSHIFHQQKKWPKARGFLERWVVCEREPAVKKEVLVTLGEVLESGFSDPDSALMRYEESLGIDPSYMNALDRVANIYEQKKDWPKLTHTLESSIAQLKNPKDPGAIPLYMRLARTRDICLNQVDPAVSDYQKILKLDENYLPARIALANLYGKNMDSGLTTHAINEYRKIWQIDFSQFETYRSLAKIFEKTGLYDKVYCLFRILEVFGVANETERNFLRDNRDKVNLDFKKSLTDDDRSRYLLPEESRIAARKFLNEFGPVLDKMYKPDLGPYGFKKSDRLTSQSKNPYRDMCDKVAVCFGVSDYEFYLAKETGGANEVLNTEPPTLVISPHILKKVSIEEQRFVFGEILMTLIEREDLAQKLKNNELKTLMRVARKGFQSAAQKIDPKFSDPDQRIFRDLEKLTPRKNKKAITDFAEKMKPEDERFDEKPWRSGMEKAKVRAGLVCTADIGVALSALKKLDPQYKDLDPKHLEEFKAKIKKLPLIQDLLLFAASDEYFAIRKRLGIAIL